MTGQDKFDVPKDKLLDILRTNREEHLTKYQAATTKFREAVIKEMEKNLEWAKTGGRIILHSSHEAPTLHTTEYDNVIGLLELSTNVTISLSFNDYKLYVKDEWNWKRGFETVSSKYLGQ